jgi:voltage-gated potassium channel
MKNKKTLYRFILVMAAYSAVLLLLSEVERNAENANIKTFGNALWYSLVTMTTIGYGDYYPVTQPGRLLALIFILGSLGLLSFIIGRATDMISEIRWRKKMGLYGTAFENHVVIIGWDNFSRSIARQLVMAGNRISVVTDDKNSIDLIQNEFDADSTFSLFSDLKNIGNFTKANIDKASMVFVNLKDDTEKLITILNIRKLHPSCRFIVALENADLTDTFYSAGTSFVLSKNEIASKLMASYIFEPDVADMTNDLLTISQQNDDYDIKEFRILPQNPLAGRSFGEVFSELKKQYNALAIGLCKICPDSGKRVIHKLPPDTLPVEANDYLIVIIDGKSGESFKALFQVSEGVLSA